MSIDPLAAPIDPTGLDLDALFAASPHKQKEMLCEVLRPRINSLKPGLGGKILNMILGMDNNALIELEASPRFSKASSRTN